MFDAAIILSIISQLILPFFSAVTNSKPMKPLQQIFHSICIFECVATNTFQSKPEGRGKLGELRL
jgi:hypothetical protein